MNTSPAGAERPQLLVFAGPNGSGKSTINAEILRDSEFPGEYVNADDLARTLLPIISPTYRNLEAARQATKRRQVALAAGRDLAFATVMSTEEKVADLTAARARGYEVSLVFVTTQDVELNVQRVRNRVAQGGHPVPDHKIRERYGRSLHLLASAIEKVHNAQVYDNTLRTPRAVMTRSDHRFDYAALAGEVPYLAFCRQALEARRQSIAHLTQRLDQDWAYADASHGQTYQGPGQRTDWHLLQQTVSGWQLHDLQLISQVQEEQGIYTVYYAYEHGKRLRP